MQKKKKNHPKTIKKNKKKFKEQVIIINYIYMSKQLGDYSLFVSQDDQQQRLQIPQQLLKKIQTKSTLDNVVPPTIKTLNAILKSRGFQTMGDISGGTSNLYLGRYYDKYLGAVMPYPQQQKQSYSLSFSQNFNQKLGQTVNAWNMYVTKQADLKEFLLNMKTPERRQQWFSQQIQSMTNISAFYKWITTLFYAYVFPHIPQKQSQQELRFKKTSKFNFLGLSSKQQKQLMELFLLNNNKSVFQNYNDTSKLLKNFKEQAKGDNYNTIQQNIKFFLDIPQNSAEDITFYLKKNGLDQQKIQSVLQGKVNVSQSLFSKNAIKSQVLQYLSSQQPQRTNNNQILFKFPLSKNMKQMPKFQLVKPNKTYYQSLVNLFAQDSKLKKMII